MSNNDSNIRLWNSVEKTDVGHTKPVTIGSRKYTAIDATYQQKKATEIFGPYGETWGLKESEFDYCMAEQSGLVIHRAVFFYPSQLNAGGSVGHPSAQFPIHNAIKAFKFRSKQDGEKYLDIDEDFAKKMETNTISKALSRIGFNTDVFLGKFENQMYMDALKLEQNLENIDKDSDAYKEERDKFFAWLEKEIKAMKELNNVPAVNAVYNQLTKKASGKCDILQIPYNDYNGKEGIGTIIKKAQTSAINRINNKTQ